MEASAMMMRSSSNPPTHPRLVSPTWIRVEEQQEQACFDSLPLEVFYNIVAYLGPTSSSLCHLSQLTHEYNSIMTSLGDVMLHRALLQCRTPILANSPSESSISLFVRHARVSRAIQDKLEVLENVSQMDFPSNTDSASSEDCHESPTEVPRSLSFEAALTECRNRKIALPWDILNALNIALCLLGCTVHHYFTNANDPKEVSTKHAVKIAMERRVTNLCSKIGAKAYNYAKSRMVRRQEREDQVFSAYNTAATSEEHSEEGESDVDDDDDEDYDNIFMESSEQEGNDDVLILEKSCLVMHYVVLRQQQNATQRFDYNV